MIVTRYDPSSCSLNNFMAFIIDLDASFSSSSSRWKKKISHHIIDYRRPRNDELQAILVQEIVNAIDLLFLEECSLLLMREQLITGPVFVMLRFVMIFVGLGSERELD